jgi:uncharacterized protein
MMGGIEMTESFSDNVAESRFELRLDGGVVFASYRRREDVLAILHVEAPPALRGTGAADRLMRAVADTAREQGWRIQPYCGYAAVWLRRHRDYADLLA